MQKISNILSQDGRFGCPSSSVFPSRAGCAAVLGLVVFLFPLALCGEGSPGETENLVGNSSFEQTEAGGPLPMGWTVVRGSIVQLMADGGHTERRYLRMLDTDPKAGIFVESKRIPVRIGGKYTASAWMRTADNGKPGLYINFYDDLGTRIHDVSVRADGPTDGWVRVDVDAIAPLGASEVTASAYSYVGDRGTFDFDDVQLVVKGGRKVATIERVKPKNQISVDIGSRLELFVDRFMVDGLSGSANRVLHHPQPREVVLQLDRPWEGPFSGYFGLFHDGDKYRLYYRGWGDLKREAVACVAESSDGVHFTRPDVGLYSWDGSKKNNIVWMGAGTHNFTVMKDANPNAPDKYRYKALASAGPKNALVAFVSPDGYKWSKLREEPVITDGAFDSQNLAFWDPLRKSYVSFFRDFHNGVRDIKTCTSPDFIHWTQPQWLDYGETPHEHLYTNATLPYFRAPHIYLGFPCRFVPARKKVPSHKENGINDGVLMSSRDGVHFERWLEALVRPGPDPLVWTDRNNYIVWGLAQTSDTEMSIYWTEHYRYPTARVRRGLLRIDGFVSVGADRAGGELLTRPFTFSGKKLMVNYATSAVGSLRFELCDAAGEPCEGFSLKDSQLLFGDEIAHEVIWKDGSDVSSLAGKNVRLRVRLSDADIYSFRFAK